MVLARHVSRRAGARVEASHAASRDHRRPGREGDGTAALDLEAHGPDQPPVIDHRISHDEAGEVPDRVHTGDPAPQRGRDRGAGVEDVHVAAAPAPVAGGGDLGDPPALARPTDPPGVHLPDPHRPGLAQECGEARVAQPAPGFERVLQMGVRAVGLGLAEGGGDGHLRHHRGAPAADHVPVDENDPARARLRRRERRIHAGAARPDHQDVGVDMEGFRGRHFRPSPVVRACARIRSADGARPRGGRAHSLRRRGRLARRRRCAPRSGYPSARPWTNSRSARRRSGTPAPD